MITRRERRVGLAVLSVVFVAAAFGQAAADPSKTTAARPTPAKTTAPAKTVHVIPDASQGHPSFSVDMVMNHDGKTFTMKRTIDHGNTRMDMRAEGMEIVQIVLDDEAGTSYTLMPKEKRAMKQTRAAMAKLAPAAPKAEAPAETTEPKGQMESLGQETIDGRTADKYRVSYEQGSGLMWLDAERKLPLRMEAEGAVVKFENYQFGPQPAALFEVPKGYEIMDLDAMMAKMPKGMTGMGMSGMGMGGMAGGMAQGFGGSMGGSMGGAMGASLGGALGGPIGSMIGQYVGQKVGAKIGAAAAGAITPGK